MKTEQGKVTIAFKALLDISQKQIPSFAAFKLFRLKKALQEVIDFQAEQEQKMMEEIGGSIDSMGRFHFDNEEKSKEFIERHKEMDKLECEINIERMSMFMKEIPEISISEMESLDPFIDWKE